MKDKMKIIFVILLGVLGVIVLIAVMSAAFKVGTESGDMDPETPETSTVTATETSPPSPVNVDDVVAEFGTDVQWTTDVTQTEPGRIDVHTNLMDDGEHSANIIKASALCEAAARVDGVHYVSVLESDGTTMVVYGHPRNPGQCMVV